MTMLEYFFKKTSDLLQGEIEQYFKTSWFHPIKKINHIKEIFRLKKDWKILKAKMGDKNY